MDKPRFWRISGPPLALQIMILLLGGLVVAQVVTLFLTLLLPPEPQPQYSLNEIARTLSGQKVSSGGDRPLQRVIQAGPPDVTGPGWLTSDRSRHDLAQLLNRDDTEVILSFFTPLPFAGTARVPRHMIEPEQQEHQARADAPTGDDAPLGRVHSDSDPAASPTGFIRAAYKIQMAQATPAWSGFPGGFPATPPINAMPGAIPDGALTRGPSLMPGGIPTHVPGMINTPITPSVPHNVIPATPAGIEPHIFAPPAITAPLSDAPQTVPPLPSDLANPPVIAPVEAPVLVKPPAIRIQPHQTLSQPAPASLPDARSPVLPEAPAPERAPRPQAAVPESMPVTPPPQRGLFGLVPAPFVEGDFIAALKLGNGQWAVVQPVPEAFPNGWQRRVLLWFAISFALVAPLGWIFAQRVVRPLTGFALAAEQLGRDPHASVLALEGPAEVGRAAHAFNRMQSRLKSFVDDRTAFVGAISHDLRTPLTRLRFRIEDAPDSMRDGMLAEVDEMEQMITSVLNFIRDASEPGSREQLDLRSLVEDVVEDALFVGKDVTLAQTERAPVEVDALGMRRVLGNLVENAVKYGDSAEVRLFTDEQEAVAEIRDNGPGLPEDELERVFQPFYRAPAARASTKRGTGLGLAVCRSIARAHGGDVKLVRGPQGLVAQLRLPLAYGASA